MPAGRRFVGASARCLPFAVASWSVATWSAADAAAADAESLCAAGEDGWGVIAEASSEAASSSGFLCNYRVDGAGPGPSGVAITIEYFCSASEGRTRYESVAGPKDTETFRDDDAGVLVTEEGPQARNPDNRQADGVFSQFFTDADGNPTPFGLQEKEWKLLNEQVFATVVVLTNERGVVGEGERVGVGSAEPVARALADRSRSSAACAIPSALAGAGAPGVTTAPAATGTHHGGGVPVGVLVGAALGLAALGGGVTWQRRRATRDAPDEAAAHVDVHVGRRPDPGEVDLDTSGEDGPEPSVAIGVRTARDDDGDPTVEGAGAS